MAISGNISGLHVWSLLVVSLTGLLMGINRTMKTRKHESRLLQSLATVMGLLLIGFSIFAMFRGGVANSNLEYTVLIMMILGLSLCARPLEKIHVTLVFTLILGLGIVWTIGHFGIPHSKAHLLLKENIRYLFIALGVFFIGTFILTFLTIERLADFFLEIFGLGPIVIILSCIGLAHAVIILATGNNQGVMRFFLSNL
jgi:hypothetical protein